MFHNTIMKNSEKIEKEVLVENLPPSYPTDFCIICTLFYFGKKVKIFDIL